MNSVIDVEVIVGGGGVAGTVTAMALHQIGYEVLVIEPGLNDERRLMGELLHPPGVMGLARLGVLSEVMRSPAAAIKGFCISFGTEKKCVKLPYELVPSHRMQGFSLEHHLIRQRLTKAVRKLPRATVVEGARIIKVDQGNPSHVIVHVARGETVTQYRCQLLVAADGASSPIRKLAGIGVHKRRIATLFGYWVPAANLPEHDYGSVFLGGDTPILAYPVGNGAARILFDIPYDEKRRAVPADCLALAEAIPAGLRRDIEHAIATQQRTSALVQEVTADRLTSGRVVLMGDAAVTCHPLTATGMTMCITDALLLRDVLAGRPNDLRRALQLHQRRRRWRHVTRLSLADALRDAFCGQNSEMRMVRRGILKYWINSSAGRSASMALLSTADGRLLTLIRQFILVVIYGVLAEAKGPVENADGRPSRSHRLVRGVSAVLGRQLSQVLGKCRMILGEDFGWPLRLQRDNAR